jgi:hypothetical protein
MALEHGRTLRAIATVGRGEEVHRSAERKTALSGGPVDPRERLAQLGRAIAVALAAPRTLYQGWGLPGTLTRSV